jgi:ATP-dependent HslUV protease subunit HslV
MMIVADKDKFFLISGDGNVIEPDGGVVAIGSGGNYALASAKALYKHTKMDAKEIALEAMKIAGEICIFTNVHLTVEEI